jgi:hypothetical protein
MATERVARASGRIFDGAHLLRSEAEADSKLTDANPTIAKLPDTGFD